MILSSLSSPKKMSITKDMIILVSKNRIVKIMSLQENRFLMTVIGGVYQRTI